MTALEDKNGKP